MRVFRERYEAKSTENAKLLLIVLVFLIAAPRWVINLGKHPYVAGHITLSFEIMIFNLLFNAIASGIVAYGFAYAAQWLGAGQVGLVVGAVVNPFMFATNAYFLYRAERNFYGCTRCDGL